MTPHGSVPLGLSKNLAVSCYSPVRPIKPTEGRPQPERSSPLCHERKVLGPANGRTRRFVLPASLTASTEAIEFRWRAKVLWWDPSHPEGSIIPHRKASRVSGLHLVQQSSEQATCLNSLVGNVIEIEASPLSVLPPHGGTHPLPIIISHAAHWMRICVHVMSVVWFWNLKRLTRSPKD